MEEKSKLAWLKVLVPVLVALLSLVGVALGVWAQLRLASATGAVRETSDAVNEVLVPKLDQDIRELRQDMKKISDVLVDVRERLARVEATRRPAGTLPSLVFPETSSGAAAAKTLKDIASKEYQPLPRLEIRQLERK